MALVGGNSKSYKMLATGPVYRAYVLTNSQCKLNDDKGELQPEGDAEDRVLAEVYSESLILGTYEDGRDNVSAAVPY
jgi:hypothetical protein